MDNSDIPRFVKDYVDAAFEIISLENPIAIQDFDKKIRHRISEKMGISEEIVLNLHHSLHWSLFNRGESPLELIQPSGVQQQYFVVKPTKADYDWREPTVDYVLENYRKLLEVKLKQINTALQQS